MNFRCVYVRRGSTMCVCDKPSMDRRLDYQSICCPNAHQPIRFRLLPLDRPVAHASKEDHTYTKRSFDRANCSVAATEPLRVAATTATAAAAAAAAGVYGVRIKPVALLIAYVPRCMNVTQARTCLRARWRS
jgi:hypothetical protein